jgi:hypothetical protein
MKVEGTHKCNWTSDISVTDFVLKKVTCILLQKWDYNKGRQPTVQGGTVTEVVEVRCTLYIFAFLFTFRMLTTVFYAPFNALINKNTT